MQPDDGASLGHRNTSNILLHVHAHTVHAASGYQRLLEHNCERVAINVTWLSPSILMVYLCRRGFWKADLATNGKGPPMQHWTRRDRRQTTAVSLPSGQPALASPNVGMEDAIQMQKRRARRKRGGLRRPPDEALWLVDLDS